MMRSFTLLSFKRMAVSVILFLFPIHSFFIKIKNYFYDKNIISPTKVCATVISVGNISLGGTGKTPFVIALSNFLVQRGKSVGVLTTGHGRKNSDSFLFKNQSVERAGDETLVLKKNLSSSIPIYVSKNKILGSKKLVSLGCDTIVLDDAFQHRKIYRDIDVVLVNPDELKEKNKKTFPWGVLREPFYNINRANIIITNKINLYKESSYLKNSLLIDTEFENDVLSSNGKIKKPVISFRGIPEDETRESFKFDLEDEITKTCKSFAVNNFKQEKNLIDAIKQNCRKIIREKTGKRPFTNVNIARV